MSEKAAETYKEEAGKEENALQKGSEEIGNIIESLKPPVVIDGGEVGSHLNEYQGKYVDIGLNTNGNDVTTDDWELFYAGNGRIYLIAADYVPTDTLAAWQVIGDNGKLKEFQKYTTYGVRWPSTPTEFLALPTEPNNYLDLVMHKGYTLDDSKNNSKAVSQLLNTTSWNGIKTAASADKQKCIDFVIGGPTLEMWCEAWNEAVKGDTNGFVTIDPEPQTSGNGYGVKHGSKSSTYLYVNGTTSTSLTSEQLGELGKTYKTFFPHTGTSAWNGCSGYWLASPSAIGSLSLMGVYGSGHVNYNDYNYDYLGVRPVVCLESGVQLTETSKGSNIYNVSM